MYSVKTVKNSIRYLYRGAIHESGYDEDTVNALLRDLDYKALASVFQQDARRVYACEIREKNSGVTLEEYRGRDLFGQRAAPLYEHPPRRDSRAAIASRSLEVWLKEDGNLMTAFRVSVNFGDEYEAVCREIRGYPWGCPLDLNLERLTGELRKRCELVRALREG